MSVQVVGAGLGRTGTHSLKVALERLLGAPCYHMLEVFARPADIPVWQHAIAGEPPDWGSFLGEFVAAVDWPVAAFWRELSVACPDALILLSVRDVDAWWTSAERTIFEVMQRDAPTDDPVSAAQMAMVHQLLERRFTPGWRDEATAKGAYDAHNAAVRAAIPAERLVEWHPGDGWAPICSALGLPSPADPFPHVNTTSEFRAMVQLDEPG